jgi:hypothetical protein
MKNKRIKTKKYKMERKNIKSKKSDRVKKSWPRLLALPFYFVPTELNSSMLIFDKNLSTTDFFFRRIIFVVVFIE